MRIRASLCAASIIVAVSALSMATDAIANDADTPRGTAPGATAGLQSFLRTQMSACNAYRRRFGEDPIFAVHAPFEIVRRVSSSRYIVRFTMVTGVGDALVDLRRRRITAVDGVRAALPTPLDFCPTPIWAGPMHD